MTPTLISQWASSEESVALLLMVEKYLAIPELFWEETMISLNRLFLFVIFLAFPLSASAQQCNFDKKIGKCVGTIKILSTSGSAPSYSAEIAIESSAGSCSKVEYFLDNTPQTAIIRSSGVEHESLFGTKPIKKSAIRVIQCTAYENGAVEASFTPKQLARYGRCAGDPKMVAELDGQYSRINAMILNETLVDMKEMQDYFASDNQDNPKWIRRQQLLAQCL